jgi:thioredoxin 1
VTFGYPPHPERTDVPISRSAALIALVVVAATAAAEAVTARAPAAPASTAAATRSTVRAVTPAELDAALHSGTWVIVEFGADYCLPCARMEPILQDLQVALGTRVQVRKFSMQEYPAVARKFKVAIMPTQIVFKPGGEEVFRHLGYLPAEELYQVLHDEGLL